MPRRAFPDLGSLRVCGVGDLFGDAALRLSPRSLERWVPGPRPGPLRVHVITPLDARLTSSLRERGFEFDATPAGTLVRGDVAELERILERTPVRGEAAAILAAHRMALRPRGAPVLMGIVNVTPDSFSDGGLWSTPQEAVRHGIALAEAGARILDVGGESTRPGSPGVEEDEELRRVIPVIEGLAQETDAILSVDTRKSVVARAALEAGASIVNDVSAGRDDPELLSTVAHFDAELVLMHMQGTPSTMQEAPRYVDAPAEVCAFLRRRVRAALDAGVAIHRIGIDPGIGFGKRLSDNLALLRELAGLRSLGLPLLIGLSRKSFLGALSGEKNAADRDRETIAATSLAALLGADVHRVHDVRGARRAIDVASALFPSASEPQTA